MKLLTETSGSVLMETVLVMPLFLSMVMGALQFAHIYIAKQVVNYAAYSAARATLSVHKADERTKAEESAKRILSWLILPAEKETNGVLMPDYADGDMQSHMMSVSIDKDTDSQWIKTAEVKFAFPLVFPIAAQIIRWGMNLPAYDFSATRQGGNTTDLAIAGNQTPHIILTERCALPKPYIVK